GRSACCSSPGSLSVDGWAPAWRKSFPPSEYDASSPCSCSLSVPGRPSLPGAAEGRLGFRPLRSTKTRVARIERDYFLLLAAGFVTKMDLGTMQCTPLRMSTTWVTRQSPAIEVSA